MEKIEKVMVCVDFSDYSNETVGFALELCKGIQPKFVFLNIVSGWDIDAVRTVTPYFPGEFSIEGHVEKTTNSRRRKLEELIENLCPAESSRVSTIVSTGIPYEKILQMVKSENIDLVVMGNKGRGNLAGTLFGSNAEKVFRHSPVPVLSVRNRQRFSRELFDTGRQAGAMAAPRINKIIAAIDFSIYSPRVLEHASKLAASTSAELIAVNIINQKLVESIKKVFDQEHPDTFSAARFLSDETAKRTLNLADLLNIWVAKEVRTRTIIRHGVPFEELLRVVDSEEADLLVMNSKGRTNLAEYLFGTTAEKAFRHCPVPVVSLNIRK